MKVKCLGCGFIWWKPPHPTMFLFEYQREAPARDDMCLPCQKRGRIEPEPEEDEK